MINIIFSSFNGEKTLPKMLNAFTQIDLPFADWQLIAVNNNSTDQTQKILESYIAKLPLIILFEEKKGKNHALNYAVEQAQGNILVFTDDDIIPNIDWLSNIIKVVNEQPDYAIFGGRIIPYWSSPPMPYNTTWINMGVVYAITPDSLTQGKTCASNIWGPNMVIRRSIFDMGFRFDVSVGPNGTATYTMGSETAFTELLEKNGFFCWFEPSWIVQHIIRDFQMTPDWVLSRAIRYAKGNAEETFLEACHTKCRFIFGVPRYLLMNLLLEYIDLWKKKISLNAEEIFKAQWKVNYTKGLILKIREIKKYNIL